MKRFTKVPDEWYRMFSEVDYSATALAVAILRRAWARQSREILLTNELAKEVGMDRRTKARAVQQLQDVGLISIRESKKGKSPSIKLIVGF
jgi:hypothetical protein